MMESFLKQAALLKYEMFGVTCEDLSCKYLDSTAKVYAKFLGKYGFLLFHIQEKNMLAFYNLIVLFIVRIEYIIYKC